MQYHAMIISKQKSTTFFSCKYGTFWILLEVSWLLLLLELYKEPYLFYMKMLIFPMLNVNMKLLSFILLS